MTNTRFITVKLLIKFKKMKKLLPFVLLVCLTAINIQAQSLEDVKAKKAELEAKQAEEQAKADAYNKEIADLDSQIEILSGWQKGFNGSVGFDLNNSFNWVSSPNRDARSVGLNIGVTAFANRIADKYFWRNKGIITKAWQDVDLNEQEQNVDGDGLFNNGTVDIVNLASLYGYKLGDKIAISALAELNTSVEHFLDPGTFDFGVGITWTPMNDLVMVIHPFNYHVAFSGVDERSTTSSLGTKIRADYTKALNIGNKEVAWSSTLTTFIPYKSKDEGEPTLFEITWLNTLNFQVWKGIGVAVGFGIRNAEFESEDMQGYLNLGLSYGF
jgi:hypothetical protein